MEFNIRYVVIFLSYFVIQLVKNEPVYLSIQLRYHKMQLRFKFITGRNGVVAKVIFLHLFVILFTGVCVSQHALQEVSQHALQQVSGGGGGGVSQHALRSMSGRYASYWNAFLFLVYFHRSNAFKEFVVRMSQRKNRTKYVNHYPIGVEGRIVILNTVIML